MSVLDHVTSFVDGRVRLRHPALKDAATAELVTGIVSAVEGITAVQNNPVTGSLLIFYDPAKLSREQLLELAEQGVAFLPALESAASEKAEANAEVPADAPADGAETPAGAALPAVSAAPKTPQAPKAPVDELLALITSRKANKVVNRAMLVSLLASLAALPLGSKLLHSIAGGVMTGGVIQHLIAHRKTL